MKNVIFLDNLPRIFHFFFLDGLILFVRLYATKLLFFYHQDAVFERNLFHNGHKQQLSLKKWNVKKWITIQITTLLFLWTKISWWNVVPYLSN